MEAACVAAPSAGNAVQAIVPNAPPARNSEPVDTQDMEVDNTVGHCDMVLLCNGFAFFYQHLLIIQLPFHLVFTTTGYIC